MFVGCLHSCIVGLSILTSGAKVPGVFPVTGTFFVFVFFSFCFCFFLFLAE